MSKQTAVEWLLDNLLANGLLRLTKDEHHVYQQLKTRAKLTEKQQIEDGVSHGWDNNENGKVRWLGEQYYNETYGGDK